MTIYLDIVLIENICMNYIILFATSYLLKKKIKYWRLLIASFIGAIYSILAHMEILKIYSNIILKIVLSVIIVYVAYHAKNIKQLFKELIFFYLISFLFGGTAFALLYFIKPEEVLIVNGNYVGMYPLKIAVLGGIIGFTIITICFKFVKSRISKKDVYYEIQINFGNKETKTKALLDTGNMLKDPMSDMPVVIVEKDILKNILPNNIINNLNNVIGGDIDKNLYEDINLEYITKFRIIPFNSIGKTNGMLVGFKTDKITIKQENYEQEIENVIVGIYENKLSEKNQYHALIGLNLLEGSERSELITNISR